MELSDDQSFGKAINLIDACVKNGQETNPTIESHDDKNAFIMTQLRVQTDMGSEMSFPSFNMNQIQVSSIQDNIDNFRQRNLITQNKT